MHDAPVVKWALEKEWEYRPVEERKKLCDQWIEKNLTPLFALFDDRYPHYLGFDYGRVANLSSIAPLHVNDILVRHFPFLVELSCVPKAQQAQILWAVIYAMPNFKVAGMDATGMGHGIAEDTADEFDREQIIQISLSDAWYRVNGVRYQTAFAERTISLPRHQNVKADIQILREINGIIKFPSLTNKDLDNQKIDRHGDTASFSRSLC